MLLIKWNPNATPENKSIGIFYGQWHRIFVSNTTQSLSEAIVGTGSLSLGREVCHLLREK